MKHWKDESVVLWTEDEMEQRVSGIEETISEMKERMLQMEHVLNTAFGIAARSESIADKRKMLNDF